jgi:GMP synthase-like glutamine amidotransferase
MARPGGQAPGDGRPAPALRVHCLQHVPFEGPGHLAAWLAAAGYPLTVTRLDLGAPLPAPEAVDLLLVLGGPMSVNDEAELPWLAAEKALLRACVQAGKAVLGICLGAQLIASALGARVYRNPVKEIGWYPVRGVATPDGATFRLPPEMVVFHWHGETFDLPAGALRLAASDGCVNQAFQLGRTVIGLQFHLETTPESARELVAHCGDELVTAPYVQSAETILAAPEAHYATTHAVLGELLTYLIDGISHR